MFITLPEIPQIPEAVSHQLKRTYIEFADQQLPVSFEKFITNEFGIDLAAEYAGLPIRSPFGKASGQLSMTRRQVQDDIEAGLGFVILKTVIAQDETGHQSMQAWATTETKMTVEPIQGKNGETGWTVSWKGRGWHKSFADYLQLIREANQLADGTGCLIVPSCKYHLPASGDESWNTAEYEYTTRRLYEAWNEINSNNAQPLPLEKDFSPTLAGDRLSQVQEQILPWLNIVPRLIKQSLPDGPEQIRLGLKVFNTLFDDEFQLEMLSTLHESKVQPDFLIYGNRLFDPHRKYDGKTGIAYGGPDLSDRNLRVLTRFRNVSTVRNQLPLSATGDIQSGRRAVEYLLCGAENFQLHTYFQLPATEYTCRIGNKTYKALHELYFHPTTGFLAWLFHLAQRLDLPKESIRYLDIVREVRDRQLTLKRMT
ncbi:MAG: hypothetical protein KDA65_11135 [Planctomycetaceae bacterium]|nr:hypothetical protein [Planctomycetaceae bacterium]